MLVVAPVKAGAAVVTETGPPKVLPALPRLIAWGSTGGPAKVAVVPVVFTVMLPVPGSGKALRFVSAPNTKVAPVPPTEACVPPMRVVPRRFTVPEGVRVASPTTVRVWPAGSVRSPAVVVTVKFPPTVEVLSVNAFPFVRVTEPSVAAAVVSKPAVPATVRAPDWLMSPPAMAVRFPLAVSVGNTRGALSNASVRFRRLVRPASAGTVAPAFTLRSDTSRKFPSVPANESGTAKLFA